MEWGFIGCVLTKCHRFLEQLDESSRDVAIYPSGAVLEFPDIVITQAVLTMKRGKPKLPSSNLYAVEKTAAVRKDSPAQRAGRRAKRYFLGFAPATVSLRFLPALNAGTVFAGVLIRSPV